MGDTLTLARRDAADIINSGGFESDITFDNPGGDPVVIKGTASKHHMSYDDDGLRVNTKNAQITVNEADLVDAGITTRNAEREVNLKGRFISYVDSTGVASDYVITEVFPNETLGHIVCTLGEADLT